MYKELFVIREYERSDASQVEQCVLGLWHTRVLRGTVQR